MTLPRSFGLSSTEDARGGGEIPSVSAIRRAALGAQPEAAQQEQRLSRMSVPDGYWVLADDVAAARQAITGSLPTDTVDRLMLCIDGCDCAVGLFGLQYRRDQGFRRWRDPDSNRGHHDFQSCDLQPRTQAKTLQASRLRRSRETPQKTANPLLLVDSGDGWRSVSQSGSS
jgi:hypothetical protein